ncbi:MAG: hypothetical protein LLF96_03890, partial [Eubacteriales bacterium]|nr:hypothetical protein [Eubacteriales bacterium]
TYNVTDVTVTKNGEPLALTINAGYMLNGVVYLPLQTATEATGIAFTLNEAADSYTVALPTSDQTQGTDTETTPAIWMNTEQVFVFTGADTALTLPGTSAGGEPVALHPVLNGETVYVPLLAILQNAGSVVLPSANGQQWEVAFSLENDLYQLSYTLNDDNSVTGITMLRNQEPQILAERTGLEMDSVLYLPLQTATEATGVTFTFETEANRYAVATPSQLSAATE